MIHTIKLVISCYNNGTPPVGFPRAKDLLKLFPKKYKITILLYG